MLVVLDLTVRSMLAFRGGAAMRLAVRAGMVLLLLSCLIGIGIAVLGHHRVERGLDPARCGAAGVPKFPHGMMLHAIQWLPALAWVCDRASLTERQCVRSVTLASFAAFGLLVFSLWQTFTGQARFDITSVTAGTLFGASLLALAAACTQLALPLLRRRRG